MSDEIKVYVIERAGRKNLSMRYVDPMSGHSIERSTGTTDKKEADKIAAKWEAQLQEGRWAPRSKTTWEGFRERYEAEVLPGLADATAKKAAGVFNWIERELQHILLADITGARLSHLQARMRKKGLAESTIKGNMAYLKSALRWAERVGILAKAPKIETAKRTKGSKMMKGRPITGEEFDRMLAKVPASLFTRNHQGKANTHTKPDRLPKPLTAEQQEDRLRIVESWRHYLRGLWFSGLRLAESLELWWDQDGKLRVDLDGKRPMLRIPAALEKGNQERLLPMAPEFAEFLFQTPEDQRTGRVFNPLAMTVRGERLCCDRVSFIVREIGKAAGVKVNTDSKTGKVKYASAHDLRRSFGERWSHRLMPVDLMALMRHESIETTLRYYVGRNAQATADILWEAHKRAHQGDTLGDTASKDAVSLGD